MTEPMTAVEPIDLIVAELVDEPAGGTLAVPDVELNDTARDLLDRELADSTRAKYERAWPKFAAWCDRHGITPLPADPNAVLNYTAELAATGLSEKTLGGVIGAICYAHLRAGHEPPDTGKAWRMLKTHRRDQTDAGRTTRKARVLSPAQWRSVFRACEVTATSGLRDRAMLMLCYRTGRRWAEVARLRREDVIFDDGGLLYLICKTKTDQTGENAEWQRLVPHHEPDLCVVRTVTAWAELLAGRGITTGPLLRRVDRHGRIAGQIGAAGLSGASPELTNQGANAVWRAALLRADLDPAGVSTHSARRSAMTNGNSAGVALTELTDRLGYVRGSRVALGYIDAAKAASTDPLAGIL